MNLRHLRSSHVVEHKFSVSVFQVRQLHFKTLSLEEWEFRRHVCVGKQKVGFLGVGGKLKPTVDVSM